MTRTTMTATSEKSVEELRQESERTREALATTVGALRDRVGDTATELKTMVSPAHIKQEIKDYVRREREGLVDAVQRKAKENPLQVAAIGAAVAYPALSLLRALPAPLWLIGAGLFLTSRRGQQTLKDVQSTAEGTAAQASEKVSELATSIQSNVEQRVADARDTVAEARDAASAKVESLTDRARAAYHDTRDAVTGTAHQATAQASATADGFAAKGADMAGNLKDRTAGMAASSQNAVADFVKQNPLLVAGVGAAVGALIAASIPPSEAENRLFGSRSEKLKDKAREAAAQGIEGASEAVAAAAGAAATAAAREGLDASGVQDALSKAAGSVRRVADRGLDAALGETSQARPGGAPQGEQQANTDQPITERNLT